MTDLTGLGAVVELANGVINRIWPDASEAEKGKLTLALAQLNAEVEYVVPWAASQTDLLADDWLIVEYAPFHKQQHGA